MMGWKKTLILILLSFIVVPLQGVFAQGPPPHRDDQPGLWKERERIRENIETFRMWKLLEALDLTSEQSTQFLPVLKDFRDAKQRFHDKRSEHLRELEAALESEVNEKKLKEALAGLEDARGEFEREFKRFLGKAKNILTLEQQAKFHLFEEKFERRLRETIQEIRGKGHRWKE
jgi:Spy/CpxP family protein refolding chaperone